VRGFTPKSGTINSAKKANIDNNNQDRVEDLARNMSPGDKEATNEADDPNYVLPTLGDAFIEEVVVSSLMKLAREGLYHDNILGLDVA
jgi:hypothetical protein